MSARAYRARPAARRGFTLLEVMVAMAILAIALSAVFSAEAGSVRMATRARKLGWASMLVRCKMGEIEEQIAKEGFPAIYDEGEDKCCVGAEIDGFTCKWEIEPVSMPDTMFESEDGDDPDAQSASGSDSKIASPGTKPDAKDAKDLLDAPEGSKKKLDPAELLKDPKKFLGGGSTPDVGGLGLGMGGDDAEGGAPDVDAIAAMAMQYIYPILKPSFESQIRRATVTVIWKEGATEKMFDVTQYLVAEQPIQLPDGTENPDSTGTGAGSSSGTPTQKGSPPPTGSNLDGAPK